jgi:hypothetical protein
MQSTSINIQMARVELSQHLTFRSQLLAEIPDLDQETLADTLEGLTNLKEMLAEVIRSALDDEAMAAGIALRLADLKARLDRFEARAKRKRHWPVCRRWPQQTCRNWSNPTSPRR